MAGLYLFFYVYLFLLNILFHIWLVHRPENGAAFVVAWNDYKDHVRRNNPEIGKDIDDAEKNSRIVDSHGDDESGWLEQAMETFQHSMEGEAKKSGIPV